MIIEKDPEIKKENGFKWPSICRHIVKAVFLVLHKLMWHSVFFNLNESFCLMDLFKEVLLYKGRAIGLDKNIRMHG